MVWANKINCMDYCSGWACVLYLNTDLCSKLDFYYPRIQDNFDQNTPLSLMFKKKLITGFKKFPHEKMLSYILEA